ncbi:MAG TPA: hypothetical protein VMT45_07715 [Thermoanaerobaculaceae bacterium]|nr:hypothetical protein [Thermoanaerobaculaceae bacterium]
MTATAVRALAWVQWRLLVNGLRGRRRDTLERASRWLEVITPAVLAVLGIPVLLLLTILGGVGGFALARWPDGRGTVETIASVVLLFPLALVILRPFLFGGRGYLERSDLVRLLPIRRSLLFNLEFVRAVADPAVLAFVAPLLAVPCGALLAGMGWLALAAFAAGIAFLLALVAIAGSVLVAAQLLLRDRRRAEAVALIVGVGVLAVNLAFQFVGERRPPPQATPAGGSVRGAPEPGPDRRNIPVVLRVLPPFVYAHALGSAASGRALASVGSIGALVFVAVGCYGLAAPLRRHLLETPARSIRKSRAREAENWALPFVSRPTAAVATVQLRTILRTVRGRTGLIMAPLLGVFFVLGFSQSSGRHSPELLGTPLAMMVVVILVSLQSLAALSSNQFASDGRGLPLLLLQPLSARTLVRGKILGIGVLQLACMLLAMVPVAVLGPPAHPSFWVTATLGGLAALALLAPVSAVLSALFPKQVDLSRWGRASNPHATASLVTFLATGLAVVPLVLAEVVASGLWHRPWLAPLLMAGWFVCAGVTALLVLPLVERVLVSRRENLTLAVLAD